MNHALKTQRELWAVSDVAKWLKVSKSTVYLRCRCKKNPLPHYDIQGTLRFIQEELEGWLNSFKVAAEVAPKKSYGRKISNDAVTELVNSAREK